MKYAGLHLGTMPIKRQPKRVKEILCNLKYVFSAGEVTGQLPSVVRACYIAMIIAVDTTSVVGSCRK